jgi:hypothetical protein
MLTHRVAYDMVALFSMMTCISDLGPVRGEPPRRAGIAGGALCACLEDGQEGRSWALASDFTGQRPRRGGTRRQASILLAAAREAGGTRGKIRATHANPTKTNQNAPEQSGTKLFSARRQRCGEAGKGGPCMSVRDQGFFRDSKDFGAAGKTRTYSNSQRAGWQALVPRSRSGKRSGSGDGGMGGIWLEERGFPGSRPFAPIFFRGPAGRAGSHWGTHRDGAGTRRRDAHATAGRGLNMAGGKIKSKMPMIKPI